MHTLINQEKQFGKSYLLSTDNVLVRFHRDIVERDHRLADTSIGELNTSTLGPVEHGESNTWRCSWNLMGRAAISSLFIK